MTVRVRLFDSPSDETLGSWYDPQDGTGPRSDVPWMDEMLDKGPVGTTRQERFEFYAAGYSNGEWATRRVDEPEGDAA